MKLKAISLIVGMAFFSQFSHAGISIGGNINNNVGTGGKSSVNVGINTQVNNEKNATGVVYSDKNAAVQKRRNEILNKMCGESVRKKSVSICQTDVGDLY